MKKLPPDQSFGHVIRDVNRILQRELGERINRHGVSLGHWYVLRVLWIQDGLTQSEIAQRSGVAAPGVVTALRSLITQRIVIRDRHPTDQRKNVIFLTKKGRQLEAACLDEAFAINESALSGVTGEDFRKCMQVLRHAKRNLEQNGSEIPESVTDLDLERTTGTD